MTDIVLTKEERELIIKKFEYTFKKKANAELETKPLNECSEGAKLLAKLKGETNG